MTIDIASRLEIEDLAARYNLAVDLGDPAGWVSCSCRTASSRSSRSAREPLPCAA